MMEHDRGPWNFKHTETSNQIKSLPPPAILILISGNHFVDITNMFVERLKYSHGFHEHKNLIGIDGQPLFHPHLKTVGWFPVHIIEKKQSADKVKIRYTNLRPTFHNFLGTTEIRSILEEKQASYFTLKNPNLDYMVENSQAQIIKQHFYKNLSAINPGDYMLLFINYKKTQILTSPKNTVFYKHIPVNHLISAETLFSPITGETLTSRPTKFFKNPQPDTYF